MALLLAEDYEYLSEGGIRVDEDEAQRFVIFRQWELPDQLYTVDKADVLITLPTNYYDQGNDMFWVFPALVRRDGRAISNLNPNEKSFESRGWQRWSRHWQNSPWRAGVDNVRSIIRRFEWCLERGE
jgi:hypothetical protein